MKTLKTALFATAVLAAASAAVLASFSQPEGTGPGFASFIEPEGSSQGNASYSNPEGSGPGFASFSKPEGTDHFG